MLMHRLNDGPDSEAPPVDERLPYNPLITVPDGFPQDSVEEVPHPLQVTGGAGAVADSDQEDGSLHDQASGVIDLDTVTEVGIVVYELPGSTAFFDGNVSLASSVTPATNWISDVVSMATGSSDVPLAPQDGVEVAPEDAHELDISEEGACNVSSTSIPQVDGCIINTSEK